MTRKAWALAVLLVGCRTPASAPAPADAGMTCYPGTHPGSHCYGCADGHCGEIACCAFGLKLDPVVPVATEPAK